MTTRLRVAFWLAVAPGIAFAGDPEKKVDGRDAEWLVAKLPRAKDPATQAAILTEMGELRDPALLAHLVHAAGDADREVKVAAIGKLAAYGPQLADAQRDDVYVVGLQDPSPEVVHAAHDALAARLQAAAEPGVGALVDALARLGKTGQSWPTRKAAIELLERLPAPEEGIDRALSDIARTELHAEVRRAAVVALGTRAVAMASPLLSRIRSKDPEEQVRMAAEDALRRIGGPATSIVIAVLPFETKAKALHSFASDLQDYFTTSLAAAEVAQVVERRQVSAILAWRSSSSRTRTSTTARPSRWGSCCGPRRSSSGRSRARATRSRASRSGSTSRQGRCGPPSPPWERPTTFRRSHATARGA